MGIVLLLKVTIIQMSFWVQFDADIVEHRQGFIGELV
jgi:hypothetical protein